MSVVFQMQQDTRKYSAVPLNLACNLLNAIPKIQAKLYMQGGLTAIPVTGIKDKSNHEKQQKQTKPVIETQQSKMVFLHINFIFLANYSSKLFLKLGSEAFYSKNFSQKKINSCLNISVTKKNWRQI